MTSDTDGTESINCFDSTLNVSGDTIEVTVKGNFPWRSNRPGFKDVTLNLSLRNNPDSPDVAFFRQRAIDGKTFYILIVDNKGHIGDGAVMFAAIITTANTGGDYQSSQDLTFEVKPAIVVDADIRRWGSWGTGIGTPDTSGSIPDSVPVFADQNAADDYYGGTPPNGTSAVIGGTYKTVSGNAWT
jgi:hypothetical protein